MPRQKYGLMRFTFDILLGLVTGGLWWMYKIARFITTS